MRISVVWFRAIAFTPEGAGRAMKRESLGGVQRFCDGIAGSACDTWYPGAAIQLPK